MEVIGHICANITSGLWLPEKLIRGKNISYFFFSEYNSYFLKYFLNIPPLIHQTNVIECPLEIQSVAKFIHTFQHLYS